MNDADDVPGVSIRAFARMRGVSQPAVQKAIKAGRITTLPSGRIDPVAAGKAWEENTNKAQQRGKHSELTEEGEAAAAARNAANMAALGLTPAPGAIAPPPGAGSGPKEVVPGSLTAHRTTREMFAARTAELDFEERAGRLVDKNEVLETWAKIITAAKTRLLGLRAKIKTLIPHLTATDMAKIDELIRRELEELARDDGSH